MVSESEAARLKPEYSSGSVIYSALFQKIAPASHTLGLSSHNHGH